MVESSISGLKCLPPQRVRDLTCTRAPLQVFRSFEFFHFFFNSTQHEREHFNFLYHQARSDNGRGDKCLHQYAELNTEHDSRRRNVSHLIGSQGWCAFVLDGAISSFKVNLNVFFLSSNEDKVIRLCRDSAAH